MESFSEAVFYRDTFAEVNLDCIAHNVHVIQSILRPNTRLMAVVKSNAYGHGAIPVAKVALDSGASYLGVATLDEAIQLRKGGIKAPILVLGYVSSAHVQAASDFNITLAVISPEHAKQLLQAVQLLPSSHLKVHLKIDTGMGRLGIRTADELRLELKILSHPGINIEGAFTHLAQADSGDLSYSVQQLEKANFLFGLLRQHVMYPEHLILHVANSAGILELPESHMNMVRLGISLYGVYPSRQVNRDRVRLQQALVLHSKIVYLKDVPAGTSIGYGGTFVAKRATMVATVPIGYGDGIPRSFSNHGFLTVRGQKCPILGRVCMDQIMLDVTKVRDVQENDIVTVYDHNTLEELSYIAGTIPYELLCAISPRVVRQYRYRSQTWTENPILHDKLIMNAIGL
ncbi:alanine racemase [Alicyclobacillus fastidiosus]|uniref:Alanine racemase n=1 Tax=Alicyclobacillus fastidiosus TaxID=392011 RepID=A0ABV5ALS6_9BACL|nr:alanine racemase [Alicyclobacillus fastidiosus]WEH08423.1 alanine racemase [Alicyclobacillus fastidiosus]